MEAGEWVGFSHDGEKSQSGGVAGTFYRRYENHRTGDVATVFLVCGRSGPVSIHTPDVCYAADGFVVGDEKQDRVGDNEAEFFSADAVKTKPPTKRACGYSGAGTTAKAGPPRTTPALPTLPIAILRFSTSCTCSAT